MPLSRLLYFSRSAIDMGDSKALNAIVRQAAVNNARNGVTGVLVSSDDAFIQLLEGPRQALSDLLSRLYADPRHCDLRMVDFRMVEKRVTELWAMGAPTLASRFAYAPLSFERVRDMTREDLIARMSRYEADPTLCIQSQIERPDPTILV
jgi:hypothetical protein